jgi:FkbM family methyltransferase
VWRPKLRKIAARGLALAPASTRASLLSFLARNRDIEFVVASGAHGLFEGALRDNVIFGEYLRTGKYADHIISLFRHFFDLHGGGTFVDIGANIGLVSVPVCKAHNVRCFAIEPEPVNFGCLVRNIQRNALDQAIVPLNRAAYSSRSAMTFELSENNWGDHRIRVADRGGPELYAESARRTITVPAELLDTLIPDTAGPLAIKIDIQGGETAAFQGGRKVLASANLMVTEFWPYAIRRAGASAAEFLACLEPHFGFGKTIGHRTDAGELLRSLSTRPLQPFAELRENLLRHAQDSPRVYTDILLSKDENIFVRGAAQP